MTKERFKLVSAVHMFFIKGNKVLLLRRFNTGYEDGNYGVPAGHLDGNESVINAAIRECAEEVAVIVKPEDAEVVLTMHRKSTDERIDFFVTIKDWQGEIRNNEPNKCDDLSWFDLNSLPKNMIAYIREALMQIQNGTTFMCYGW